MYILYVLNWGIKYVKKSICTKKISRLKFTNYVYQLGSLENSSQKYKCLEVCEYFQNLFRNCVM